MFCMKCGKPHDGPGFLCPQCAAAQAPEQAAPQSVSQTPVQQMPEAPYLPPVQPQSVMDFTLNVPVEAPQKKKKTGLLIGLGILAVVLIAGVLVLALNWNRWFGKPGIPEDPEDYIAFLEEPRMEGMAQEITDTYGKFLEANQAGRTDTTVELFIGEEILDLLSQELANSGVDMELGWLSQITLEFYGNDDPDGSASQIGLGLDIGAEHIASFDGIVDIEKQILYLAVPELNRQYVQIDLQELGELPASLKSVQKLEKDLWKDLPDEKAVGNTVEGVQQLLLKYLTAEVTKTTRTITANGVEKSVTVLESRISQDDLLKLAQELVELLKNDPAVRQAVQAVVDYATDYSALMDEAAEEISMEAFDKMMDRAIQSLQEAGEDTEEGNYLIVETYADGARMLGRGVQMFTDGKLDAQAFYAAVEKDGTTYYELNLDDEAAVTGQGSTKNGKFSGSFLLTVEGDSYLSLELKDVDGDGCGAYLFTPEAALLDALELDDLSRVLASALSIQVDVRQDGGKLSLLAGKATVFSLDVQTATGKGKSITIPGDAVDFTDEKAMMQWVRELDLQALKDALEAAGCPVDSSGSDRVLAQAS